MRAKACPVCGEKSLHKAKGRFVLHPPANVPGGYIRINDAVWEACDSCGERILGDKLDKAIQAKVARRVRFEREKLKKVTKETPEEPTPSVEEMKRLSNIFERGQRVVFIPENKVYDYGYLGATGMAIIYIQGARNMQDSFAVDFKNLKPK